MFASVAGHAAARRALSLALGAGRLAHAYLLVGPPQVGKRTLALAVAQALLCPSDDPPCDSCQTCRLVMARQHPDLLLIGQGERRGPRPSLGLELVHDLQHMLSLAPFEGRARVVIIDGAERLTNEAANAFLKTLEEPPPASYLFLLSEAEERILPTILSRCQRIVLGPLPDDLVKEALVERWGADARTADALSERAGGRLGWALAALQDPSIVADAEARLGDMLRLLDHGLQAPAAGVVRPIGDHQQHLLIPMALFQMVERADEGII
jgi:DNA polymerase-3 subunit delta'